MKHTTFPPLSPQNNLNEYYEMICWVQPELMGTRGEFKARAP